jgi:AraC-like DNA-binding protein
MRYHHEIIEPDRELPVFYIFHNERKDSGVLAHWHKSLEISYTMSGKISAFTIDGTVHETNTGDILVINSNAVHSIWDDHNHTKALSLIFPYDFIKAEIPDYDKKSFLLTNRIAFTDLQKEKLDELRGLLDRYFVVMESEGAEKKRLLLKGLIYQILYLLDAHFSVPKTDNKRDVVSLPLIAAITEYIDGNLDKDLALDKLAATFHLSYTHLCRLFKKETGSTIHNHIVEQRLNKAVKLLMFTDKNIRYIVDACGFPNQKSFSSAFKHKYGMTPKRYRDENKA